MPRRSSSVRRTCRTTPRPSENSLAADGLLRLAALTGTPTYAELATRWVRGLAPVATEHPTVFVYLLGALERTVAAPIEVAIVGDGRRRGAAAPPRCSARLVPASIVVLDGPDRPGPTPGSELTPLLEGREAAAAGVTAAGATAYVCEHFACRQPVTTPEELAEQLDAALAARRG